MHKKGRDCRTFKLTSHHGFDLDSSLPKTNIFLIGNNKESDRRKKGTQEKENNT